MLPFEVIICVAKKIAPKNHFSKLTVVAEFDKKISIYKLNDLSNPRLKIIMNYTSKVKHDEHWQLVFDNLDYLNCFSQIINHWSFKGYFRFVEIETKKSQKRFHYQDPNHANLVAA